MHRFAVILTHNRPALLAETVAAIGPQVDMVVVIDNASDPAVRLDALPAGDRKAVVLRVLTQPPNLSELWRAGMARCLPDWSEANRLKAIREPVVADVLPPFWVAFLCDDAPPPPGWFDVVVEAMVSTGAVAGATSPWPFGGPPRIKTTPDRDLMGRMPGWAFILDGRSPVLPDERFQWWWGDTDIDWQARQHGGMVLVGTHTVPNREPDHWTAVKPELGARCGLDRLAFEEKWVQPAPW